MLLHSAWHLLYRRLAWMFDFAAHWVSDGQWKTWGRTALADLPPGRILEVAHGPGHLLLALEDAGHRPVGVDRSVQMGRQAGRRLRCAGLPTRLTRCDARALPFRAGMFAGVVATFPTDDVLSPESLEEMSRVTCTAGRVVIVAGAQVDGDRPDPSFRHWLSTLISGRDGQPEESMFVRAGLAARFVCRQVGGSTVFLLVAEKVSGSASELVAEAERALRAADQPAPAPVFGPGRSRRTVRKLLV